MALGQGKSRNAGKAEWETFTNTSQQESKARYIRKLQCLRAFVAEAAHENEPDCCA